MEVIIQLYTVRKGHNKMYLYSKDTIIANSGLGRRGTDTKEPLMLPFPTPTRRPGRPALALWKDSR